MKRFVKVKLHPHSKKQKVEKLSEEKYEIWVKSKAEENRVNNKMLELLAGSLEIEKKKLRFYSGHHRPSKMVEVLR